MAENAAVLLLLRALREMGVALEEAPSADAHVPLPSRLAVPALAWASVAATAVAGGIPIESLDPARIATAFQSERVLRIDGAPPPIWSPDSGFWRTADGWIRTHANYPHHRRALRAALSLTDGADDPGAALRALPTDVATARIARVGGLAVPVRPEDPAEDARLRSTALLDITRDGERADDGALPPSSERRPLSGIRVLDLTRVIAGPVCTRALALLGADVLRIDPPAPSELVWQHLDTGHGKRSALLDARSATMHELLTKADAVVLGYRPAALARLGLSHDALRERHPHLVVAELSAWGADQPARAGFDSLVQAASGIALIESADGETPGALPAQALDHSTGYLLAASIATLVRRRRLVGGAWHVRTSLRRVAAELLGMPRSSRPENAATAELGRHVARFEVDGRIVETAAPALSDVAFAAPRPWGGDQPRW